MRLFTVGTGAPVIPAISANGTYSYSRSRKPSRCSGGSAAMARASAGRRSASAVRSSGARPGWEAGEARRKRGRAPRVGGEVVGRAPRGGDALRGPGDLEGVVPAVHGAARLVGREVPRDPVDPRLEAPALPPARRGGDDAH